VKGGSSVSCIHENTKIIIDHAFEYSKLTSIVIPDSVVSIGDLAFYNCSSLTSVHIGKNVTTVGRMAFYGCNSLTSITLPQVYGGYLGYIFGAGSYSENSSYVPSSLKTVTITASRAISSYAFYNCYLQDVIMLEGLERIRTRAFNFSGVGNLVLPEGLNHIADYAFEVCGLSSIDLPASVEYIGEYAFKNCSSLTKITYRGTVAQWKSISKALSWKYDAPVKEIICSDGTVTL
jgi:hypothetical protein